MKAASPIRGIEVPNRAHLSFSTTSRSDALSASAESSSQTDAPYERYEITDPSASPYRLHGKLFVRDTYLRGYCSATAVNSANMSVVFTAAHCMYGKDFTGGWADSFVFVPGYKSGDAPYGEWVADKAMVPSGWLSDSNPRVDFGALIMEPLDGQRLAEVIGGRGFATKVTREQHFKAFGYPAEQPFDGERLYVCEADAYYKDLNAPGEGPAPTGIGCDMTAGSSGGGWVINGSDLNSVNSYGYATKSGDALEVMFGPYFGNVAAALYKQAGEVPVVGTTPLPSVSPSPSVSVSVPEPSPTPSAGSPAPSPSPTEVTEVMTSARDGDDSRSPLDIRDVVVTKDGAQVSVRLRTWGRWFPRLLRRKGNLYVDLDVLGGGRGDYYAWIYFRNGRFVAKIEQYTQLSSVTIGRGVAAKTDGRTVELTFSESLLDQTKSMRWFASSRFKNDSFCKRTCWDEAPNNGWIQF